MLPSMVGCAKPRWTHPQGRVAALRPMSPASAGLFFRWCPQEGAVLERGSPGYLRGVNVPPEPSRLSSKRRRRWMASRSSLHATADVARSMAGRYDGRSCNGARGHLTSAHQTRAIEMIGSISDRKVLFQFQDSACKRAAKIDTGPRSALLRAEKNAPTVMIKASRCGGTANRASCRWRRSLR
jgi:hypothetical protein